jgi:hypothetical protein
MAPDMGYWKDEVWGKVTAPSVGPIVAETAITLTRLAGCFLIHLFLKLMAAYGFGEERVKALDSMDYWATLACIGVFLLSQVIGQATGAFHKHFGEKR